MKKIVTLITALVLITGLIISQTGCAGKSETIEKTSYYMDTVCTITVYDMEEMSDENLNLF